MVRNWGFVPYTKEDLDDFAITYRLIYSREWLMVAENPRARRSPSPITIPDINQVLKKMKGRLLPFGWWYYLNRAKYMDRARIGFLGVLPEYQHTGVAALLYMEHYDVRRAQRSRGRGRVDSGEQHSMNRALEAMGGDDRQTVPYLRAAAGGGR